jgi:hypothetical protein
MLGELMLCVTWRFEKQMGVSTAPYIQILVESWARPISTSPKSSRSKCSASPLPPRLDDIANPIKRAVVVRPNSRPGACPPSARAPSPERHVVKVDIVNNASALANHDSLAVACRGSSALV